MMTQADPKLARDWSPAIAERDEAFVLSVMARVAERKACWRSAERIALLIAVVSAIGVLAPVVADWLAAADTQQIFIVAIGLAAPIFALAASRALGFARR